MAHGIVMNRCSDHALQTVVLLACDIVALYACSAITKRRNGTWDCGESLECKPSLFWHPISGSSANDDTPHKRWSLGDTCDIFCKREA
ncbi:hypothetical protein BC936DRAFT_136923, partial [Jimgerdemannia flammicorona]